MEIDSRSKIFIETLDVQIKKHLSILTLSEKILFLFFLINNLFELKPILKNKFIA